jgi:hypothetical protein
MYNNEKVASANRHTNTRRQKFDKERSRIVFKICKDITAVKQRMWNVKTKVIPVIVCTKGTT